MSKKKRDDSYFAAGRRKNKKYMMIIIPIVIAVAAIGIAAAAMAPSGPNFGPLGSAHQHAVFEVKLDGQAIDFSQSKYQVRATGNQYIHVEGGDGTTLHRHSTMVPFGEFLRSVNMNIENNCFVTDTGEQFCDEEDGKQLRYFVGDTERDSIMGYIIQEEDRVLVIYGDETQDEINQEIDRLADMPVIGG